MSEPLNPLAQPRFRMGVLVPPANPTVEIEYPALAPRDVALHVMRLPVFPGDLDARNQGYVASFAQAMQGFGTLKLDAIAIALTGSQYRLLPGGDRALCDQLSDAAGVRVETATLAIDKTLRALGQDTISLMSPYPEAQTRLAVAYWRTAGYQVHTVRQFANALVAYQLSAQEISTRLLEMAAQAKGAVILSGTGMRTVETLTRLVGQIEQPLLASNPCSVWSVTAPMGPPSAWMRAVMPAALFTKA